jgi:ferrous iron transport protein B
LAVIFNVSAEDEEAQSAGLLSFMKGATNSQGQLIFTFSSTLGLLVFFSIALQCMSTFAVALKEASTRSLAWMQLIGFNMIAYLLAVGLVQSLRAFGIS